MPTDLGVNEESIKRIITALTDGIIASGREIVLRHTLAVLTAECPRAGLGYIGDYARQKINAALSAENKAG